MEDSGVSPGLHAAWSVSVEARRARECQLEESLRKKEARQGGGCAGGGMAPM